MIKALFLDIDGTLVSFETHRVGEPTRNALAEARRRGLLLFIATGRHRCDLNNLGDLAFDGYVTLNGQYCYDARGVIYCRSIDPNDIRTAVGLIEREPFPCLFIEEDQMYINCADDNFRAAQRLLNFGDPPVESPSRALRTDIFQLMPFIGPEREPWLMERLPRCRSRASVSTRSAARTASRRTKRWLSATARTTSRCCAMRASESPWAMRPRKYRRRPTT